MEYRVNKMENLYFILKIVCTVIVVLAAIALIGAAGRDRGASGSVMLVTVITYLVIIALFVWFQKLYVVAHLKGNGIRVSERQFPEVYQNYLKMADDIGLKKVPKLFLVQEGGLLNAFAIRFSGKNYIAIYSEVFSLLHSDLQTLMFVIGHELAHVRRAHLSKRFWTFPSSLVPFLTAAYSRRCEYTCDNIGSALAGEGARSGLVLLAAGKDLYRNIDVESYVEEAKANHSGMVKFVGLFMSHPYLPKRLHNVSLG